MQKDQTDTIGEVVTQTIWEGIQSFLDLGFTLGSGDQKVRLDVWTLLLVVLSFLAARFFLKWMRLLLTRNMQEPDKLKFISFFKFIQYITYIIVGFAVLSASGINVTPFLAASAALLVGLGLALQEHRLLLRRKESNIRFLSATHGGDPTTPAYFLPAYVYHLELEGQRPRVPLYSVFVFFRPARS